MQHFHILRVKYLGATPARGSRVKIVSERTKTTLTIPFDYALNSPEDMAIVALKRLGFHIVGMAEGYVITDTFNVLR